MRGAWGNGVKLIQNGENLYSEVYSYMDKAIDLGVPTVCLPL